MNLRFAVSVSGLLLLSATSAFAQNPANGNFEDGVGSLPSWNVAAGAGTDVSQARNNSTINSPYQGAAIYSAEFATGLPGDANGNAAMLSQNVSLPTGGKFITFDYNVLRSDTNGTGDVFTGQLVDLNGAPVMSLISRNSTAGNTNGWVRSQIDLTGLASGVYRLEFALGSDGDRRTTRVSLDNVAIVPAPPALFAFAFGAGATGLMGLRRRVRK